MARWLTLIILGVLALRSQTPPTRTVRFGDLPAAIARRFDAANFDERIREIERDTARREAEGELEHLVNYALQSERFTSLPRIEPAASAREYVENGAIPVSARARILAFLHALARPGIDPR